MVNPRNLESLVSQRQYFQNPVVVLLVLGSREQIHDSFDVFALERMHDETYVVRDPTKPVEPEERGRNHTCHSDTDEERDHCLQSHRSGCGKRCCGRFHEDNDISVGSRGGEKRFGQVH